LTWFRGMGNNGWSDEVERLIVIDRAEIKDRLRGLLDPVVGLLSSFGITPMGVTLFGVVLSAVGSIFLARGSLLMAGVILIVSGLCDTVDGSLARRQGSVTTFGAFIDSTGDRIMELLYFGALLFYFSGQGAIGSLMMFFVLVALSGSLLTSYVRARAEGLGLECRVGWLERPERVAILIVGLLLGRVVLIISILFIAVMSFITVFQRILHVKRISIAAGTPEEVDSFGSPD
jgi:CDP-diacylglycerol--glycerol-3-phosphate 3-phosphatidyltransferase